MRHILVVDDAVLIRALLREIFRREGYVVHEAVGVRDAVERYREVRPEVVTLDLTLPDGSGLDCLARLKSLDPGARVVVVTAVSRDAAESAAIEAGALEFVAKPFRPEQVTDAVRRSLSVQSFVRRGTGEAP